MPSSSSFWAMSQLVFDGEGDGFALRAVPESGIERLNLHDMVLTSATYWR